jgi:ubiquinone/menaquinone biosynthesis C-methylase UbiE
MTLSNKQVRKKYNRYSYFYDYGPLNWLFEKLYYSKWRRRILSELKGKVLEVGVGTGKSLRFYNYKKVNLVGADISEKMLSKAIKTADKHNYPVDFRVVSDKLPFPDNTFDHVFTSCVLCSASDPVRTLKEMARVCKKSGSVIMIEHVLSKNKIIAFLEHIHNPFIRFLFGYNVNRDTVGNIKKAGLKIVKEKNLAFHDVFKELEVIK